MDDAQFEQVLARLLRADFSAGTEAFRDGLLARCLEVLGAEPASDAAELGDADLELLSAAGDVASIGDNDL